MVCTIHMGVARLSALVTIADYSVVNTFSHTVIKYEVLSNEARFDTVLFYLACILDNTAVELIYILKTNML